MAQLSSKFAAISPGMSTEDAQSGLVSIMKAWDIDVENVQREIMDNINTLGNKFALSNQDVVEGMKRSAAALSAVGEDWQSAFALFAGGQEVVQNAEKMGVALRSISLRIHGYSEQSEDDALELDDELKNITGDLIDLTKTAAHPLGVSVFKDGSTTEFKSLVDYLGEISEIWDEMTQKQQNDFLQKAFAKTQAQTGAAMIKNYDAIRRALVEMESAGGSSEREMSIVTETLTFKLNALKETWTGTFQALVDRGTLGWIIDGLTKISEGIQQIVNNKTALTGILSLITGALATKNNVGGLKSTSPTILSYSIV